MARRRLSRAWRSWFVLAVTMPMIWVTASSRQGAALARALAATHELQMIAAAVGSVVGCPFCTGLPGLPGALDGPRLPDAPVGLVRAAAALGPLDTLTTPEFALLLRIAEDPAAAIQAREILDQLSGSRGPLTDARPLAAPAPAESGDAAEAFGVPPSPRNMSTEGASETPHFVVTPQALLGASASLESLAARIDSLSTAGQLPSDSRSDLILGFGVCGLLLSLILFLVRPDPSATEYFAMRLVMALSAALMGMVFTGEIGIALSFDSAAIDATGAIGFFVLVYKLNPAPPPTVKSA